MRLLLQNSVLMFGTIGLSMVLSIIISRKYIQNQMNVLDRILDNISDGKDTDEIEKYSDSLDGRLRHKIERIKKLNESRSNELIQDKKIIEQMIGDISHQIKTPMSNILIYGELISDENIPVNDRIEFSERIINQSKKINGLVENMTKVARLESGVIQLKIECSDIKGSVEESISCVSAKLIEKNISIDTSEVNMVKVQKCKKWTEEALINILDNAIKYSETGSTISLKTEIMPTFTALSISDRGVGIKESEYTEIFKRFYRANDNKVKDGVGLGLFIARTIMEKQGGYITVKSQMGKGSTFTLFFQNCNN